MSVDRTNLLSSEVANIIGLSDVIRAVRILTVRAASTLPASTSTGRLNTLKHQILDNPTSDAWFQSLIYYVVTNNPSIDWEHFSQNVEEVEAEIYAACLDAIYGIAGEDATGRGSVTVTSVPTPLKENTLNGSVLTLKLSHDYFVNEAPSPANFKLVNAPAGLSVDSVALVDDTTAHVTLAFDGTDFDEDHKHVQITIALGELGKGALIASPEFTIEAVVE